MQKDKIGVLLVNIGSPDSPTALSLKKYLKLFLSDDRVIDIPKFWKFLLLNFIIIPFRASNSAKAYKSIWRDEGSPLVVESLLLVKKLQEELGDTFIVKAGMSYGTPYISEQLELFQKAGVDKCCIVPMYPQYASSSTGSALENCFKYFEGEWNIPELVTIGSFYNKDFFLDAYAEVIKSETKDFSYDHLLLSYHGLPERHIIKSDISKSYCLKTKECCSLKTQQNSFCYKFHCYETSKALVKRLGLEEGQYSTSFQSRLGRSPWIKPYTDKILESLSKKGVKRLAVVCPSFVIDCLETLEEVGIRLKKEWLEDYNGEDFKLISCLNSNSNWVSNLKEEITHRVMRNNF
jgi:ferrochelatase